VRTLRSAVFRWVGSIGSILSIAPVAWGAVEASLPPGGGLGALGVRVDLASAQLRYRACPSLPCVPEATSAVLPIPLDKDRLPDAHDVVTEVVPIGQGRSIVHVHLRARGDQLVGWDAVLAGAAASSGGATVIFSGKTGFVEGQDGERTGPFVQVLGSDAVKHVLVGTVREDLHLCGQDATILAPTGLDPGTLTLRGATVQRLPSSQREGATRIIAAAHGGPASPALAPLLVAGGASSEVGSFKALTDGDPATTWAEARPGVGQGEFVEMSAPEEVGISRLSLVVAPPSPAGSPKAQGTTANAAVAPRSFFLVTARQIFAVTLPEDGRMHPGAAYDIALPEPVHTSCLALVLDDAAYDRGRSHPEVTVAELVAYSEFDGGDGSLEAVARALDGGGARAAAARGILARAGAPGFVAMAAAYDKLDAAGRNMAIGVATSASGCEASGPLLIRAMSDPDHEVQRKATEKLQNPLCGKAAVPALVKALDEPALREKVAPLVASLAPGPSLEPLARAMGVGDAKVRGVVRRAFAQAAARSPLEAVTALIADSQRAPDARLELLRAAIGQVPAPGAREAADAAIDDLLRGSPALRLRFLIAEPMAALARAGDAHATARFLEMLARDPDPPVRTRLAELAAGIGAAEQALVAAVDDGEPRVREASIRAIGASRLGRGEPAILGALSKDPWTFVRTAAAATLALLPATREVDEKLGDALENDASPKVRAAVVTSLATHHAVGLVKPIRSRLDSKYEDVDVRLASARALGALCDSGSLDRLTELARAGTGPLTDELASQLSLAATEALGSIHPPDLAKRLAPLMAKDARALAQEAARSALAEPTHCR
jgi:hypothetical protein